MLENNSYLLNLYRNLRSFYYKNISSDEKLIKIRFKRSLKRELNLENPNLFNDKIQWLKLNWFDPLAIICADKYAVRNFVEDKVGKNYLNKLYAVYDSVDEIDISNLPNSFVMKATHSTGDNLICYDKSKVNWKKQFKRMRKWLDKNIYWTTREWVYKDIKPRIICEKILTDENGNLPMDYKIFCFHGEPKLIQVDIDRYGEHKQLFYNTNWSQQQYNSSSNNTKDNLTLDKPKKNWGRWLI